MLNSTVKWKVDLILCFFIWLLGSLKRKGWKIHLYITAISSLEEAKKYDHGLFGAKQDLFFCHPLEAGLSCPVELLYISGYIKVKYRERVMKRL